MTNDVLAFGRNRGEQLQQAERTKSAALGAIGSALARARPVRRAADRLERERVTCGAPRHKLDDVAHGGASVDLNHVARLADSCVRGQELLHRERDRDS